MDFLCLLPVNKTKEPILTGGASTETGPLIPILCRLQDTEQQDYSRYLSNAHTPWDPGILERQLLVHGFLGISWCWEDSSDCRLSNTNRLEVLFAVLLRAGRIVSQIHLGFQRPGPEPPEKKGVKLESKSGWLWRIEGSTTSRRLPGVQKTKRNDRGR